MPSGLDKMESYTDAMVYVRDEIDEGFRRLQNDPLLHQAVKVIKSVQHPNEGFIAAVLLRYHEAASTR